MAFANRKLFPELDRFPTADAGKQAYKAWQKQNAATWRFWVILIGYSVVVGILVAMLFLLIRRWIPLPMKMIGAVVGGVTGGSGIIVLTYLWRQRCRVFLRRRLHAEGVPVCVPCGYDLRGIESTQCPECGAQFEPIARRENQA